MGGLVVILLSDQQRNVLTVWEKVSSDVRFECLLSGLNTLFP